MKTNVNTLLHKAFELIKQHLLPIYFVVLFLYVVIFNAVFHCFITDITALFVIDLISILVFVVGFAIPFYLVKDTTKELELLPVDEPDV